MTREQVRRAGLGVTGLALTGFFIVRGVVPAFKGTETDFPNYYTAGSLVLRGADASRFYDDAWFQARIYETGMTTAGKFSPFPPVTAVASVPLALLSPATAKRVWTVVNIALLCLACVLLARWMDSDLLHASVFALLAGTGLANGVRFGQLYLPVVAAMLVCLLLLRRAPFVSGVAGGVLAPVKYYPAILLVWLIAERKVRPAVVMAGTMGAVFGTGILVLGWPVHSVYLSKVLPDHLQSKFSGQDPYAPAFQSWDSLFRNLLTDAAHRSPAQLQSEDLGVSIAKAAITALVLTTLVVLLRRMRIRNSDPGGRISLALLGLAPLLLSPGSATYHGVLLWVPVGSFLVATRGGEFLRERILAFGSYAAIGFLPYRLFGAFSGGPATVLAYPRLWMMTVLFCAVGMSAWKARPALRTTDPHP